ncbi:MAG: hypothetical protein IKU84_00720 [Clostridia bacterium]|nr:hypothetical protein [Clostridia bacterium]
MRHTVKKSKRKNKQKNGRLLFAKITVAALVIYSIVTIISLQINIHSQEKQVSVLEGQVEEETMKKEQLTQIVGDDIDEEYIISEAQKNGYAAPNERVFKDVAGQ